MQKIPLAQGKFAIVDDEDYPKLGRFTWRKNNYGYVVREVHIGYVLKEGRKKRVRKMVLLHRSIIGMLSKKLVVDHINGDPLDNRRENMRVCTRSQNIRNAKIKKTNKSGYKGVSWFKRKRKWVAYIHYMYKSYHLGYFNDLEDAAKAYDKAALQYFGEYARLNFPID
jgi:hypothetical protein